MPNFKVGTGPGCCCSCILMSDPFTGTISPSWEQIAGTWTTSSGFLSTSSTSGFLVHDTAVPGNKGIWKVPESAFSSSPGGTPFRLVAWKDANNYAYVEITNAGNVKLGYFSGGAETVLETRTGLARTPTNGDQFQFRLCWDGVRLVGGYQNSTVSGPYTAPDNLRPGFATPATGTSWTWSGTAELSYHNEERGSCPTCATCWDLCETFPETIELFIPASTFSNTAVDNWTCTAGCDALNNQTFILTLTDGDTGEFGAFGSTTFGKTACPMYEYVEEEFCDFFDRTATMRIRAVWFAGEDGDGLIRVTISIYSTCTSGVSGNISQYQFFTTPATAIPSWGACVDVEYETDVVSNGGAPGPGEVICQGLVFGGPFLACEIDNTKTLTVIL